MCLGRMTVGKYQCVREVSLSVCWGDVIVLGGVSVVSVTECWGRYQCVVEV